MHSMHICTVDLAAEECYFCFFISNSFSEIPDFQFGSFVFIGVLSACDRAHLRERFALVLREEADRPIFYQTEKKHQH